MGMVGGAALSIASTFQQNNAEKTRAAIQEQQYRENRESAITARNLKQSQSTLQLRRDIEQIAGQKMDAAVKALETSESTKVAAAEAGVGGQTTELLIQDPRTALYRQNTKFSDQVKDMQFDNLLKSRGLDAEAISRINSVDRGVAATKSLWLAGAEGAISSFDSSAGTSSKQFVGF